VLLYDGGNTLYFHVLIIIKTTLWIDEIGVLFYLFFAGVCMCCFYYYQQQFILKTHTLLTLFYIYFCLFVNIIYKKTMISSRFISKFDNISNSILFDNFPPFFIFHDLSSCHATNQTRTILQLTFHEVIIPIFYNRI
jgi:hypothetical protein